MNRCLKVFFAVFVFGLVGMSPRLAWSGCCAVSCPIDTQSTLASGKGEVRVEYSFEYVDQDTPRAGRDKVAVGAIEGEHNEIYTVTRMHRLSIDAGLTNRLNLQVVVPFVNRAHQHLHVEDDELETWNLDGMGDISLLSRYAWVKPESPSQWAWTSIAGLKLPTGSDDEKNHHGAEAEPSLQPGSGALSVILGGVVSRSFQVKALNGTEGEMPFFVSTSYQLNDENDDKYQRGNSWDTNVGIVYPVSSRFGLITQLNAKFTEADEQGHSHGHSAMGEHVHDADRTGGTYAYVSPGLQFSFNNGLTCFGIAQLPVYQRVNVIQLTSDINYQAGVSYRFQAF